MHALWNIVDAVAAAVGERDAIVWRRRHLRYELLRDRSLRLAAVLQNAGLGRRTDRSQLQPWESGQSTIGCYLLNGPEYLEVMLGSFAASAAPFNVNYRYVAAELAYLLDDADACALVYHARYAAVVAEVLPRLTEHPQLLLQVADDSGNDLLDGAVDYESAISEVTAPIVPSLSPDDLYVLYTGGTTGMPKGALWRQADVWTAALAPHLRDASPADIAARATTTNTRSLTTAPFMHGAGQWSALSTLLTGGTVVISDVVDHLDPAAVWSAVERERVNVILIPGEAAVRPLVAELASGRHDPSSVKVVIVGAAATTTESKQQLLHLLPQATINDTAGAAETGAALRSTSTKNAVAEPGVFKIVGNGAVLDADRGRRVLPGEDVIGWYATGGAIPLGYLGDPAKTLETFVTVDGDRWAVPGDRARLLADGRVQLLGRDAVTINSGGEKIFAEEVEHALLAHPAVADVVVVPRPSERWGQEVAAVIALSDPTVSDDDLRSSAATHIARYKLPKSFTRVTEVRRSPAGKPDYAWARELVASPLETADEVRS